MNSTDIQDVKLIASVLGGTTGEVSVVASLLLVVVLVLKALKRFRGRSQCCTTTNTCEPSGNPQGNNVEQKTSSNFAFTTSVRDWLIDLQNSKTLRGVPTPAPTTETRPVSEAEPENDYETEYEYETEDASENVPEGPPVLRRSKRIYGTPYP
jgi:hypothetical protein